MGRYNYFASPRHEPRAVAFRGKYFGATPGKNFWFENQPYAGPPMPPSNVHTLPMRSGPGPQDFHSYPGSPPRFPAGDFGPTPPGYNYGMRRPGSDVTGRYGRSGGEGLLSDSPSSSRKSGLLDQMEKEKSDTNDKSGWEKSDRFNNALAEMLLQWGLDQSKGEQWEDWR